jgi:hypothetical protein
VSRKRKILITSAVLLVLAAGLGFGSFATFNAQTNNPGNAFSYGTIVLSNTKQSGTACLSTGGGSTDTNVNTGCDQLINITAAKPGDSGTANVTLQNVGSINASSFKLFMPSCTGANVGSETYHGTANPCGALQIYVQQWTNSNFTGASACLYGGAVVTNTCDFSDTSKTLTAFTASYNSSSNGIPIGSGLNAGSSAYFTIGVKSASTADNTSQGRQGTFDLDWYIAQ